LKSALITGVTGQDGAYLAQLLLSHGYAVYGTHRPHSPTGNTRLKELELTEKIELLTLSLADYSEVQSVVDEVHPDEVYNLAAQSSVAGGFQEPLATADVDALGTLRLLEAIKNKHPQARFFQASSSQMFGAAGGVPVNEETPFRPNSPYGTAKLFAHWATVNYREAYGLFACSGLLFNHESPLRGMDFVTRKVSYGVARIAMGMLDRLHLGNLDARRDWGYARDYVEAMWLILQQTSPDDYVIASGEGHTVREFVSAAFDVADISVSWEGRGMGERAIDATGKIVADVSSQLFRPADVDLLVGDADRARKRLGWMPRVSFEELVLMMVETDMRRLRSGTVSF